MHFKFFLMILFLIAAFVQVNAAAVTTPTTISVPAVSENNVTSTVAISVVKDAQALNEAKSTLVHEHNEKLVKPTLLYIEKEQPDPFVLILDDEPVPEPTSGGTALYVEPENDVVVTGTKAFLCSDHEVKVSNATLCADGEGIMPEENPQEGKKSDSESSNPVKDDALGKDNKNVAEAEPKNEMVSEEKE